MKQRQFAHFQNLAYIFYVTQLNFLIEHSKEIGFPARCNIFTSFHFIHCNVSAMMSFERRTDMHYIKKRIQGKQKVLDRP